jgi:hypothetical protein
MHENIGRSLGTDYFRIADQLTREELDYLRRAQVILSFLCGRGAELGFRVEDGVFDTAC